MGQKQPRRGKDKLGQYMLEHYSVEEAFKHLNKNPH
jgi:hypothetical protein